ncbi:MULTISPECIES: ATP-binding protein [Corynebacterium]|uniref:AAA+ ATPase domain-containing protein n=1 Tax=Corynebacterium hadale TaxID=2026255 RepID=A0A269PBA0_9CORY|nr:ATP-binding protein [Corynebacterium hadale]PAJ68909.1 hypothetical protein CIG21_09550 [Corynebacterium hadale]WKC61312.1 DNA replication and repair protein RecF [Corynebacterium hadale]
MHIESLSIKGIRAFPRQNDVTVELGEVFTAIAGLNGTGKSTVLAVLGNVGNLKKGTGAHLNGDPFRVELSEIIKYDVGRDLTGGKAEVKFVTDNNGMVENIPANGVLGFRSSIHPANEPTVKKDKPLKLREDPRSRFRLIPERKNRPIPSEAKLEWPTYYLGLSRLYPVGETEDYSAKSSKWEKEVLQEYNSAYRKILDIRQHVRDLGLITSESAARKKGAGVTTDQYGVVANSAGQDNLGQILLAALSFKALKKTVGKDFKGGILLIDEIEATLHPLAQSRLFDFLYRIAKDTGFQVVCTTHSLSLLQRISENVHRQNPTLKISYFRRVAGEIEVDSNPSMAAIEADMNKQILDPDAGYSYPRVFMEDDVARLVFQSIQEMHFPDLPVRLVDGHIGWTALLTMANEFSPELSGSLIILDPDVSVEDKEKIDSKLEKSVFKHPEDEVIRPEDRNLLFLPGTEPIEKMLFEFYKQEDEDCEIYRAEDMRHFQVDYQTLMNDDKMPKNLDEIKQAKWWFDFKPDAVKRELVKFWLSNADVPTEAFVELFRKNYNIVKRFA